MAFQLQRFDAQVFSPKNLLILSVCGMQYQTLADNRREPKCEILNTGASS